MFFNYYKKQIIVSSEINTSKDKPSFKAQKLIEPLRNQFLDKNRNNVDQNLKAHSNPLDNGYMIKNIGNPGNTVPKIPHAYTLRFPTGTTENNVSKVNNIIFLYFFTK